MHGDMLTKFQSENVKERNHLGDLGADGRMILKWILCVQTGKVRTGLIWLRTLTSGGLWCLSPVGKRVRSILCNGVTGKHCATVVNKC